MKKTAIFLIIFTFFLPNLGSVLFAQDTETYIVLARPSLIIRSAPYSDAARIQGEDTSIPFGKSLEVFPDQLEADNLEGIEGNWRKVKNSKGEEGYVFDGYLVKADDYMPKSNRLTVERHERKIEGLLNLVEKNQQSQEKLNSTLWIYLVIPIVLLLAAGTFLFFYMNKRFQSATALETSEGKLNMDALAKELSPRINAQLDPKIKKISPNIIELIQIQLKEFNNKISREYQKKTHVKTIKIKREVPEPTEATKAADTKTKEAANNKGQSFGFTEETALFSAYLHKGFQRRYVELPRNNLFFGRKASPEINEHSVYELCVLEKDPTRALYRMIDEPGILEKALRFPGDYIYPVCEVYGNGNIQEASQLEYSYGEAVKDGSNWRIIKKAKLRYYLDEQLEEEDVAEKAWQPTGDDITMTLYATAPKNDTFNLSAASEEFEAGWHVFKIIVTGKDKATYELVDSTQSQTKAFHLPNKYLLPAFATLGSGSIYIAERAEMVQKGELRYVDGNWKISKKGIIQYFKS